jgi:hypothetical protein
MANLKFSGFTENAAIDQNPTTGSYIVGYEGNANTNNRWTFTQVAAGLAAVTATPYSIYAGDGTITTGRKALLAGTLQFRNSGDSSDIFKLNTDGTFTLGLGASSTGYRQVAIGNGATAGGNFDISIGTGTATGGSGVAIGKSPSAGTDGVAIGSSASAGDNGIAMGQSSAATGNGVAIGYDTDATASSIGLGANAKGTGNNSITLNATGLAAAPSTHQAFNVYMSSNSTPDLTINATNGSTINSNLKITGQGYSELHTVTSAASITPDWDNSNVQTFELTSASTTIVNPSNIKPGATYILILKQDSTGGRTVSFGTQYNFPADTPPILTTTANKADVITLVAYSSTVLMCTSVLDFTTT